MAGLKTQLASQNDFAINRRRVAWVANRPQDAGGQSLFQARPKSQLTIRCHRWMKYTYPVYIPLGATACVALEGWSMNLKFILALIFMLLSSAGFAGWYHHEFHDGGGSYNGNSGAGDGGSSYHGVPGPIAGAGLPVLAIGYGVYWLVRRRRNKPN